MGETAGSGTGSPERRESAWMLTLIAAGAALLGSVVGAASGFLIADRQISASRSDAAREERKALYTQVSAQLIGLQHSLSALDGVATETHSPPARLRAQVCEQVQDLEQSSYAMLLVASDPMNAAVSFAVTDAAAWCPSGDPASDWVQPSVSTNAFDAAVKGFVLAARDDLGTH